MKVLLVNGSPNVNGTTKFGLNEVAKSLNEEGIETEIIDLGNKAINDCIACGYCASHEGCVFNDIVNEFVKKASEADGFVFGSPVYYGHPTGRILSFLDRVFYSGKSVFKHRVGASIITLRRSGATASFDVINKYFTISNMFVIPSNYWNNVHGPSKEEAKYDLEGIETMYNLGKNMTYLLKAISLAKENNLPLPKLTFNERTNFISEKDKM